MNDNVEILRRYNRWRRGQALWSATADLPDPRVVGEAIDAACDEIERLRAELDVARSELAVSVGHLSRLANAYGCEDFTTAVDAALAAKEKK